MIKRNYYPEFNLHFGKKLNWTEIGFYAISILFTIINLTYSIRRSNKPVDDNSNIRFVNESWYKLITNEVIFCIVVFIYLVYLFKVKVWENQLNSLYSSILITFVFLCIVAQLINNIASPNKLFILLDRNDKKGSIAIYTIYLLLILYILKQIFLPTKRQSIHVHDDLRLHLFYFSVIALVIIQIITIFLYITNASSEKSNEESEALREKNKNPVFPVFFGIIYSTIILLLFTSIYKRFPIRNFLPEGGVIQKYQDTAEDGTILIIKVTKNKTHET